ncbi:MAG TPA: GDSL-type esterase/lipase family protein, partial [Polyangia bacterium]|nr:GDSL-type esterase/lipase family protein [Polyangia bacterium]
MTASGGAVGTGGVTASGGAVGSGGTGSGGTGSGGTDSGGTGSGGTTGSGGASAAGSSGAAGKGGMGGGAAGRGGTAGGGASTGGGADYAPCPTTAGTACLVLPLGDSITEGCCKSPMGGYRIELFRQAVTNKKNITFVGSLTNGPPSVGNTTFPQRHEGHGGYTISGGGSGALGGTITNSALSTYHPHIVLLKIGTNDINGNIDVANAPTRLGKLIDDIIAGAPSALIVVSSIIPTTNDGTNQRVQTYNAAI